MGETKKDKPNKSTADEEYSEEDRKVASERIHLLPPIAREESPTGASVDQIMTIDQMGNIVATKKDNHNKSTTDEENSEVDREETHKKIH